MPMHGLYLSDMRVAHFEESDRLVAYSPKKEDLEELLRREKVSLYREPKGNGDEWVKTFRKHGPLEWYNDVRARPPMMNFGFFLVIELRPDVDPRFDMIYTYEEYMEEHGRRYRNLLASAYDAGMLEGMTVEAGLPALPSGENKETDDGKEEDDQGSDQRQGQGHDREDDRGAQDDAGDREEDRSRPL